ncbi:hypothetical protein LPJ66_004712 [Kickxella alabastrina]|uniref:Uncharacterized protein n=1 Tax=Kickxella alabastrina TaxID=61397 RepID=A0ACC1IGL2_9FUNG|nr:hypothetical protein LPJ66_004712 [Kickxella alabastrina]
MDSAQHAKPPMLASQVQQGMRTFSRNSLALISIIATLAHLLNPAAAAALAPLHPASGLLTQFQGRAAQDLLQTLSAEQAAAMSDIGSDMDMPSLVVTPYVRDVAGILPNSHIRLTSADTLSDTKIFVLLAAIVFIFLIALGVAMARVSRNRNQRHTEHIRQQIVTAHRPPETLNRTILDLLPVYEVTEKKQLRKISAFCSPRVAFNECFADDASDYSSDDDIPIGMRYDPRIPMQKFSPGISEPLSGGYGSESANNMQYTAAAASHYHRSSFPNSHFADGNCDADGDVEMTEWETSGAPRMPGKWPMPRIMHTIPSSIEPPPSVAAPIFATSRYRNYSAAGSSTPLAPTSTRHSSAGCYLYDDLVPDDSQGIYINAGSVVYQDQSTRSCSRSLDLTSDREISAESSYVKKPNSAWLMHRSQPDIAQRQSRCSMAASDDGTSGLGTCAICLEEFEVGEQLRELPCKHKYHVICIDTWLVSRSTCCPYCKLDIRRWYYGPSLEDALSQSQSTGLDEHALPLDDNSAEPVVGRYRMRRNLIRGRNRRTTRNTGRWDRMWLSMRASGIGGTNHITM